MGVVSSKDGKVTDATDPAVINMPDLTNSIMTDKSFKKTWTDEAGQPIEEDYLNFEYKVTFRLQVAEVTTEQGSGGTPSYKFGEWTDAEKYFNENLSPEAYKNIFGTASYDFKKTIPEADVFAGLTHTCWNSEYKYENLPRRIQKNDAQSDTEGTRLAYRVVEDAFSYKVSGGTSTKEVVVRVVPVPGSDREYTYTYIPNNVFFPGYVRGTANSYNTIVHQNRIRTTEFSVTKNWEGDHANIYNTRPGTEKEGEDWTTAFVIQYRTESDNWMNLKVYEDGVDHDKIVSLYGNNEEEMVTQTLKDLPVVAPNGEAILEYRARELQPGEMDKWNETTTVEDEDIVADKATYHTAYTASYSNAQTASASQVTNKLKTTEIRAEKRWRGDVYEDKTVTLELKYLAEGGQWTSFTHKAEVVLDGKPDPPSENPYYEDSGWNAVWKDVPEAMPGSLLNADNEWKTQYRVEETVHEGSILEGVSTPSNATVFTNAVTTSLTVKKYWSAPTDKRTKVTVALWRTIGEISPMNEGAEKVLDPTAGPGENKQWTHEIDPPASGAAGTFTFDNLPKYDKDGHLYTYYAREIRIGPDMDEGTSINIFN